MIHLITGTPGSGKTLYAVSKIVEYVKENETKLKKGEEPRNIYSDIDGLQIEGVLPAPEDWRDTPDGSIIFYDEIQQRINFKKDKKDNDVVNALQIHRHTGHDIYGITQFPSLLHQNFKAVVGLHYHLHRGWGLKAATVYQWAYCVDSPNAPTNKRLSEQTFRFNYPKQLFNYYKSASQHTHKARIPKKLIFLLIFILAMLYVVYYYAFQRDNFIGNLVTDKDPISQTAITEQSNITLNQQTITPDEQINSSNSSQQLNELRQQYLPNHLADMPVDDEIRPSTVIASKSKCIVLNKFGERLNIDDKLCWQMIDDTTLMPKSRKNQMTLAVNNS